MAKKVIQYRYFGKRNSADSYEEYHFKETELDRIKEEYNQMIVENSLYYYNDKDKIYLLLDVGEEYDSNVTYYVLSENSRANYPATLTKASLVSGTIFNNVVPIVKLGIQAIPGTRFRINSNKDWIIMGMLGIYELDLLNTSASIMKLQFDETSLDIIDNNDNAYLIIDALVE